MKILKNGEGSRAVYHWKKKAYSQEELLNLLIPLASNKEEEAALLESLAIRNEENQSMRRRLDMWNDFYKDNKKKLEPIIRDWNSKRSDVC